MLSKLASVRLIGVRSKGNLKTSITFNRRKRSRIYLDDEIRQIDLDYVEAAGNPFGEGTSICHGEILDIFERALSKKSVKHQIPKLKYCDHRFGPKIIQALDSDSGKIVLEGFRLVNDAINAGASISHIFLTDKSLIDDLKYLPYKCYIHEVPRESFKLWSDVETPQGIMAICSKPDESLVNDNRSGISVPISVICDMVRDPGNMGTIIRTCAAFGCQNILVTKGSVNVWDRKVLRSAMGGHFRISIKEFNNEYEFNDSDLVVIAVTDVQNISSLDYSRIGNEMPVHNNNEEFIQHSEVYSQCDRQ
ncbi:hypothetical protein ACOME3_003669 [Neoechinorhynchus agilis]